MSEAATALDEAARRAVVYSLPLYEMARMRAASCPRRGPGGAFAADAADSTVRWCNGFTHSRKLLTPKNREVVSPNNDTLYDNTWLDLAEGPLLIELPEMGERYWTLGFLDAWTNPFAYAGRRTTGNRAQRLLVHGPRWQGRAPEGTVEVAAPGDDVWVIGRMLVDPDEADLAAAHRLQDAFAIRRVADGANAWQRCDTLLDGRATGTPPPEAYLRIVAAMLARNPAPAEEQPLLDSFAVFGLRSGRPAVDAAVREAFAQALTEVYERLRHDAQPSQLGGGWTVPVTIRNGYGADHMTRARVARNLIGALGIDEAMYPLCEVDAEGRPLDGRAAYEVHFKPGHAPQVDAFWSLTMYDRSHCLLVDNPIDRHSIGDRTPGLRWDADGGLRIRMQATDPGPGHNWLPTPADDGFYVVLRLYQPRAVHLQMRFTYPPLRRLDPHA